MFLFCSRSLVLFNYITGQERNLCTNGEAQKLYVMDKANNGETRGEMITGEMWTGIVGPDPISGPLEVAVRYRHRKSGCLVLEVTLSEFLYRGAQMIDRLNR